MRALLSEVSILVLTYPSFKIITSRKLLDPAVYVSKKTIRKRLLLRFVAIGAAAKAPQACIEHVLVADQLQLDLNSTPGL